MALTFNTFFENVADLPASATIIMDARWRNGYYLRPERSGAQVGIEIGGVVGDLPPDKGWESGALVG